MKKSGYKVCYTTFHREFIALYNYESATTLGRPIKYIPNKWVGRPEYCGPLTVFKTLQDARNFHCGVGRVILKCKYKKSKDTNLWYTIFGTKFVNRQILPKGTVFADKVKIKRQVK